MFYLYAAIAFLLGLSAGVGGTLMLVKALLPSRNPEAESSLLPPTPTGDGILPDSTAPSKSINRRTMWDNPKLSRRVHKGGGI